MSHLGLMRTIASNPAHRRPHLGIPGLAWDQSNLNPASRVVLPLLMWVALEGAVGHQGGQTGTGVVHQSVGVAVADHPVGVAAHTDHPVGVAAHTDHPVGVAAHMDHPAGAGVPPGVGVTPVKVAGVAGGLLVLGMVQAFQGILEVEI